MVGTIFPRQASVPSFYVYHGGFRAFLAASAFSVFLLSRGVLASTAFSVMFANTMEQPEQLPPEQQLLLPPARSLEQELAWSQEQELPGRSQSLHNGSGAEPGTGAAPPSFPNNSKSSANHPELSSPRPVLVRPPTGVPPPPPGPDTPSGIPPPPPPPPHSTTPPFSHTTLPHLLQCLPLRSALSSLRVSVIQRLHGSTTRGNARIRSSSALRSSRTQAVLQSSLERAATQRKCQALVALTRSETVRTSSSRIEEKILQRNQNSREPPSALLEELRRRQRSAREAAEREQTQTRETHHPEVLKRAEARRDRTLEQQGRILYPRGQFSSGPAASGGRDIGSGTAPSFAPFSGSPMRIVTDDHDAVVVSTTAVSTTAIVPVARSAADPDYSASSKRDNSCALSTVAFSVCTLLQWLFWQAEEAAEAGLEEAAELFWDLGVCLFFVFPWLGCPTPLPHVSRLIR